MLHIILEVLTLKVRVHLLDVGVIGLRTLQASELVEEGLSWRSSGFIEPRKRVDVVGAEDTLSLKQFHVRPRVDLRGYLVENVEVFMTGFGERGREMP